LNDNRIISNKVTLCAIKTLTAFANKSTGISHSSDKKMTIDIFKILKKNNESFIPSEIKSWLILKAKWKPEYADNIAEIAQKILNGKTVRSQQKMDTLKKDIIITWRIEAKDSNYNSEEWKDIR